MHSSLSYLSSSLMLSVIASSYYAAPEGRTEQVCCKMCADVVCRGGNRELTTASNTTS
jgi:hypothetical protein